MSLHRSLPRIIELQNLVYNKQKAFAYGLRSKMPHRELQVLNEEIKTLHQELLAVRSSLSYHAAENDKVGEGLTEQAAKLVFVDDDEDDRALIREGLSALQIVHCTILEFGAALLSYLHKLPADALPEAIVLDLNMPQMNGLDLLRILKAMDSYHTIPVYILTTASDSPTRQRCMAEGATDFFTKPSTLVELYEMLNAIHSTVME